MNLVKGQALELKKEDGSKLTKLRLGAGWDVAEGKTIDLDLSLHQKGGQVCFYNNKSIPGATLDKDDRTGGSSADGADENINIVAADLTGTEYTVAVTIFDAAAKGQFFSDVKRAFVEVVDTETNKQLCRYDITADGGHNSALVAGKITVKDGVLTFVGHEEFSTKDLNAIAADAGCAV